MTVRERKAAGTCVLQVDGVLDATTYLPLRDAIIKAALDNTAVIIDVSDLRVPAPSALVVFTSARWHVTQWPDVPIALVCAHEAGRNEIARSGVARYVPVFGTLAEAVAAVLDGYTRPYRRRVRAELPRTSASVSRSRQLVEEWLSAWSLTDLTPVAKLVVTVLVENVLEHTQSTPRIRMETGGDAVTLNVEDDSSSAATRRESLTGGDDVTGLAIVAAMCRAWGNLPTPTGKVVWATIGPENQL
ncbi:MAG: sulfate transporter [Mycobacteriaceae bacterium]|nr:sulfate transporter [Mycobacteriaceae bacterium]